LPLRRDMQMIFQDPFASLNPRKTVGQIIGTPFRIHKTEKDVKKHVQDLMDRVGLNPEHYNRYPHEFSGGQRQRIGVARALALRPKLIVCDEPVSALDVSIQAQILNLLEDLQGDFNLTYLFISHDLSVVRHISDRIAVMYLGRVVELAPAEDLHANPKHPYTAALLSAIPKGEGDQRVSDRIILTGDVPSPVDPPSGCPFHPRCPKARSVSGREDEVPENCRGEMPPLVSVERDHEAACWYPLAPGERLHRIARI
jgi:oligopeptide/dipeptide ABC transporter ATP-binding protein